MRSKHLLALVSLSLAAFSFQAYADYSSNYAKCLDASKGNAAKESVCVSSEAIHQEAMVNHYYSKLMNGLDPEQAALFAQSHKAWLNYRDLSLPFAEALGGGNVVNTTKAIMEMNKARAEELQQMCENYL